MKEPNFEAIGRAAFSAETMRTINNKRGALANQIMSDIREFVCFPRDVTKIPASSSIRWQGLIDEFNKYSAEIEAANMEMIKAVADIGEDEVPKTIYMGVS